METNLRHEDFRSKFDECNARFDAIFHLTTVASKIIDSELTILKVNKALTDLLGYTSDELIGTKIMDYACQENKQHWHDLQDAMWRKGQPDFQLDACINRKDGNIVWVHVTTVAFKEDGVSYAYTVLDDFTAWKKLQESERRLTRALKYSKMAVWELDLADRSIAHSEGFEELFGRVVNDPPWDEENLLQMFLPEDKIRVKEMIDKIRPGQNFDFQGRIQTPAGIIKWVNFQGRAEKTPEQKERILGTIYDITRDKLAEREKDDFISIASHELKTPLTALKSAVQVLERMKNAPDPKFPVFVEQATRSMNKVTLLVDDLLNASLMTEGQVHLKKSRFNMSKAIDECCLHITAAGVYQILTEGIQDAEVEADFERIQRVIVNFVNNAVKYAPQSTEITISVGQEPGYLKVSVADKGPGIAKDKIPHLFERYFRGDEMGGQPGGLGLGLYICAGIIKKHGGQIGVESELGKGSTFWFTLPVAD